MDFAKFRYISMKIQEIAVTRATLMSKIPLISTYFGEKMAFLLETRADFRSIYENPGGGAA